MEEMVKEKARLKHIDIAKGLLIILVVYGHLWSNLYDVDVEYCDWLRHTYNIFVPFYMPCFFVITGFCSKFNIPISSYIFKQIKTLLLPAFFFSFLSIIVREGIYSSTLKTFFYTIIIYGGDYWFLSSLFVSKIGYWFVYNCMFSDKIKNIVLFFFFISGMILFYQNDSIEVWWYKHALLLMPFLHLGRMFKNVNFKFSSIVVFLVVLVITILLSHLGYLYRDSFYHVPVITKSVFNIGFSTIVPFILLSSFGSLMIFLCKYKC